MALYQRQVNPMLAALMAQMSQQGGQQRPSTTAPPMQAPQPQVGHLPQQGQGQPQGLLDQAGGGMNPMMMAMMLKKMQGQGAGGQSGQFSMGGMDPAAQFGGAMPTADFSGFQLPPSLKFLLDGGGLPS